MKSVNQPGPELVDQWTPLVLRPPDDAVGESGRDFRFQLVAGGKTREQWADLIGVSKQALCKWLKNRGGLGAKSIGKLAKRLGVDEGWLAIGTLAKTPRALAVKWNQRWHALQFLKCCGQLVQQENHPGVAWEIIYGVPCSPLQASDWVAMANRLGLPVPADFPNQYQALVNEYETPKKRQIVASHRDLIEAFFRLKRGVHHASDVYTRDNNVPRWVVEAGSTPLVYVGGMQTYDVQHETIAYAHAHWGIGKISAAARKVLSLVNLLFQAKQESDAPEVERVTHQLQEARAEFARLRA